MDRSQHDLKPDSQSEAPVSGADFRELRRAAGRRQAQVAAEVGVSGSYLSLIETGRRPLTPKMRARLLHALDQLALKEHRAANLQTLGSAVLGLVEEFNGEENDRVSA